jgi:hypothetical protein
MILVYFQQHQIRSITLQGNKLIIDYQNSQTETRTATTPELQQVQVYCQQQGLNTLALENLQKPGVNTQQPFN